MISAVAYDTSARNTYTFAYSAFGLEVTWTCFMVWLATLMITHKRHGMRVYMHCHQWHWAIMIALVPCTAHSTWYMCWSWSACTHSQSLQTKRQSASKGSSRALHSTPPSLICMLWGPIPNQVSCPIHTYCTVFYVSMYVCNSIGPFSLP